MGIVPEVIPISPTFLYNCNWPILGLAHSGADHFLLYTCNDICLYFQEIDKWVVHIDFVQQVLNH